MSWKFLKFFFFDKSINFSYNDFIIYKFYNFLGKVFCEKCSKKCSGNVLRVGKTYFHVDCFKCHGKWQLNHDMLNNKLNWKLECSTSLAQGGFFSRSTNGLLVYYCSSCYQKQFGTKCAACQQFVEGEVVTALGNTYHQHCFKCSRCK